MPLLREVHAFQGFIKLPMFSSESSRVPSPIRLLPSRSSKACAAQPALYASISSSELIHRGRSLIQPLPLGIIVARFPGSNCSGLQPFKLSENLELGSNDYAQLLEMYHWGTPSTILVPSKWPQQQDLYFSPVLDGHGSQ